jgi:two-component system sensor histidine kinase DegS
VEVEAAPSTDGPPAGEHPQAPADDTRALAAQVAAIEDERRRLAHALNDGPSQTLSNIVLRAENVDRWLASDPAGAREESQRLREAAVSALSDVRRFMFETYPSVLEDLGLVQTLRRYLQSRGGHDRPPVELRVEGAERRLVPPAELALFRAAQEAIASAERQSRTAEATLTVAFHSEATELTLLAGGEFDSDELRRSTELGLAGLGGARAQLAVLGGELTLANPPGGGCSLIARIRD